MDNTLGAYFDAAFIAKFYLNEPGREVIRGAAESAGSIVSSAIAVAEIFAAFHRNLREGRMDVSTFTAVRGQFARDMKVGLWTFLPVTEALLEDVQSLFGGLDGTVYLRALDALHLVTAKAQGFDRLYTNDRHLFAACPSVGIQAVNLLA